MLYTELEYPKVITTLPSEILKIREKVLFESKTYMQTYMQDLHAVGKF